MTKVYFILLLIAALLLLADAFFSVEHTRGQRLTIKLLPLALFFWVLVPLIQVGKHL